LFKGRGSETVRILDTVVLGQEDWFPDHMEKQERTALSKANAVEQKTKYWKR
jgi:hypothetical protein